jgi:YVTN family beta-propeller protein
MKYYNILLITLVFLATGCATSDDNEMSEDSLVYDQLGSERAEPAPSDDAFLRPGPTGDGAYILPNGRKIHPAGTIIKAPSFANDVGVSPDGATVVLATGLTPSVIIYDVALGEITQTFTDEIFTTFTGIVFNAAGDRFWVSGGGDYAFYEFDLIAGTAIFVRRIKTLGFPTGLVLSGDEQYMYTAMHMSKRMAKIRLADGVEVAGYPAHMYPYDLAILPDETVGFVSCLGRDAVYAIDLSTGEELAKIDVGRHPEGLALSPDASRLYVANSDSDTVSVIDTASFEVTATWDLHNDEILSMGAMPVAVEVSPDGAQIFVTCAGYDTVDVVNTADGSVAGRIPTGWYPVNAAIDPIYERLFIANAKGIGSAEIGHGTKWPSALQVVDLPTAGELEEYTLQADAATRWASNFYEDWYASQLESPIPTEFGTRSEQIKHVVFILKENKTYDQVLGDLEGAEGDPEHCIFGEAITPNTHALARAFTNCDNFFVEGDTSVIGHLWAMFSSCNDHAEKAFLAGGKYPLPDFDPATRPSQGTIFKRVLDAGLEFRNYGEAIGLADDLERYMPYTDLHYGFWNMGTSDETQKSVEIIREWEKGLFPDLIFIVLPNDHHYGASVGSPTPEYLMGDNDAGLGKLVDWISHSEYWDETAIFVTEDDPQSGWDHIDPHRTISLVISPWAKRNHTASVLYSQSSIWLTIELLLGLQPSSKFSQYSAPMFDAFTMEMDSTPYTYITNPIPFELNGENKFNDLLCREPNWLVPDGAPGMARVLWAMFKPNTTFPENLSVDRCIEQAEEEEEEGDVAQYVETVNKAIAWGKARGITVPTPEGWAQLSEKVRLEKKE